MSNGHNTGSLLIGFWCFYCWAIMLWTLSLHPASLENCPCMLVGCFRVLFVWLQVVRVLLHPNPVHSVGALFVRFSCFFSFVGNWTVFSSQRGRPDFQSRESPLQVLAGKKQQVALWPSWGKLAEIHSLSSWVCILWEDRLSGTQTVCFFRPIHSGSKTGRRPKLLRSSPLSSQHWGRRELDSLPRSSTRLGRI